MVEETLDFCSVLARSECNCLLEVLGLSSFERGEQDIKGESGVSDGLEFNVSGSTQGT